MASDRASPPDDLEKAGVLLATVSTQLPSSQVLAAAPSDVPETASEHDGFSDVEVESLLIDLPEPKPCTDAGCPNNLGWRGDVYTDDPQYGIYAESLDAEPDITAKRGVFIAVLGDAGGEVRAPQPALLCGCPVTSVVLTEADIVGHGVTVGTRLLLDEATDCEVRYLILAPCAPSFLRRRCSTKSRDTVAHGYDVGLRRALA